MKVVDLFSGCGGMSLGMIKAGYDVVAAFDNWNPAIKVYEKNFNHNVFSLDLSEENNEIVNMINDMNVDIIIGGPPCQDYSSAGKQDENGGRADLTIKFAEIITNVSPSYFIMENVDRITKFDSFKQAKEIFKEAGYGLSQAILDASFYGVPQSRKRYFLIGELHGRDNDVTPYLKKKLNENKMTMREYFGNELGVDYYYRHPRSYNRRGVFRMDEPSPTVRGVNRPVPPNYKIHSGDKIESIDGLRPLTTKERSLIQTFPKDFVLEGTKTNLEQMVGNAVPVNLARHVGLALIEYINAKKSGELLCEEEQLAFNI